MKLRSAPLDDVRNELDFVLQTDSRRVAKFVLWFFRQIYRLHRQAMFTTLRLSWRKVQ